MKIVQAASVVTEDSPPVEAPEEEDENSEPEVESQMPSTDTKEEATETSPAKETPDESE